jgi:hypothetical protein
VHGSDASCRVSPLAESWLILLGVWAASATGTRIRLPSPSTLSGGAASTWQTNDDYLGAIEIEHGSAPPGRPSNRFTLLAPIYGKQQAEVHDGRSAVLKLLARPHFDLADISSRRLELLVDGTVVGTQPLGTGWRMLAFALSTLAPGTHEFGLRSLDLRVQRPRQGQFTLR